MTGNLTAGQVAAPRAAPERTQFPALNGLRGLAALVIVATHAGFASGRSLDNDLLAAALGRLDFGVAAFFVLSGFLLYRPMVVRSLAGRSEPAIRSFWFRRLVRVVPALWLMIAVTLSLISQRPASLSDWLHYLLLVQVYDHHELDANLSQLWTLSAEIAFYAALPLVAYLVRRLTTGPRARLRGHAVAVAALIVVALAFNIVQSRLLVGTQALLWAPCYVDWFALGMLLALLSAVPPELMGHSTRAGRGARVLRELATSPLTCWTAAAVLWLITTTQVATPRTVTVPTFWQWTIQHYLFGASAFLIFVPLIFGSGGAPGRVLGSRAGSLLGDLSYSIYLWHLALLLLIQRELGFTEFTGHFWTLLVLTVLASCLVAAVSWFGVERPLLRYRRRRDRPAAAASTTAEIVNS
jgi:peptidoglycan/LPS O-acetylase OafA/YrhL